MVLTSLMGASRTTAPMSTQPSSSFSGISQNRWYWTPLGMTMHLAPSQPISIWVRRAL